MKVLLIAMASLLPLMSFASQDSCIYGVRPVSYTINSSHDVGTEELVFSLYISSSKDISIPEVATHEVFENVDREEEKVLNSPKKNNGKKRKKKSINNNLKDGRNVGGRKKKK